MFSFSRIKKSNERKSIARDDEMPTPIMAQLSIILNYLLLKTYMIEGRLSIINNIFIVLMQRGLVPY
jgi:hypothetical protein